MKCGRGRCRKEKRDCVGIDDGNQMRIQELCKGGGKREFADIAQRKCGGGKKFGGQGGGRSGSSAAFPPNP